MTALFDQPNLPSETLICMIALAIPTLKPFFSRWVRCLKEDNIEDVTFTTSFKKYNNELFVFFTYYPNATQNNRWSVSHEGKIGTPWRSCKLFKKKVSKRFASLIDAITYYETDIKR